MTFPLVGSALLVTVSGFMIVEAARASANERTQRARGGVEPPGDVYGIMRAVYPLAFLFMMGEGALRGLGAQRFVPAGLGLFVLAKALKWWAIRTLGPGWTFRIIVVPGAPLVVAGPYRFFRHPNYVAVVGELASVALMSDAIVTGPAALAVFGLLLWRRIVIEEQALARPTVIPLDTGKLRR